MKCKVHVPEAWNEHAIVEKMTGSSEVKMTENDLFFIMSSDEGCILLRIAIKKKTFENAEALHFVIRSLLQKITNAGDIDVNVPAFVSFSLELYTEENRGKFIEFIKANKNIYVHMMILKLTLFDYL